MAIIRSIPAKKIINEFVIETSDAAIISEENYNTNGESCIVVKDIIKSTVILNSNTTDHIVIKAMTNVVIVPDIGKIDDTFDEVELQSYSSIEFRLIGGIWYILSSDGIKQS
jgi:hypothetical protein